MFCGPDVMRRLSDATSSARALWSYLTSSGPKHFEHTYCAVSSYSVPHSRQARLVTAIVGNSLFFAGLQRVTKKRLPYATRLQELAPSPLSREVAGVSTGQSLHPSGRVQLCGRND